MLARFGISLAVLLACQACKYPAKADESSARGKLPSRYPSLQSVAGFELVSSDAGAVLIVAQHAELQMTLFDLAGKAQKTQTIYRAKVGREPAERGVQQALEIEEVVATTLDTRLAVAWLERDHGSTRARGLSGSLSQASAAPPLTLGDVQQPIAKPRGNLALGSIDGQFVALIRAQATPCAEQAEHDCVGYSFFRFELAEQRRSGPPLAVPAPCPENALSFAVSGARWYYGVCSASSGSPVTTVFTIQNEPSYYARADRVLEGCVPIGAVTTAGDLLVAGDCAGSRRAVRLRGSDRLPDELRMDRLEASCRSGKPLIVQRGSAGLELPLAERQDRLEAFLPEPFGLPRARAVWTGQTLLVAGVVDSKLILKGYRCDSTLLREVALE